MLSWDSRPRFFIIYITSCEYNFLVKDIVIVNMYFSVTGSQIKKESIMRAVASNSNFKKNSYEMLRYMKILKALKQFT